MPSRPLPMDPSGHKPVCLSVCPKPFKVPRGKHFPGTWESRLLEFATKKAGRSVLHPTKEHGDPLQWVSERIRLRLDYARPPGGTGTRGLTLSLQRRPAHGPFLLR